MNMIRLLAQSDPNSPINQWLNQNPLVLGLIILVIGVILVVTGSRELQRGVAIDKYGKEYTGGMGQFISIVRVVGGMMACGFAIYKMTFG